MKVFLFSLYYCKLQLAVFTENQLAIFADKLATRWRWDFKPVGSLCRYSECIDTWQHHYRETTYFERNGKWKMLQPSVFHFPFSIDFSVVKLLY